jgi:integrase
MGLKLSELTPERVKSWLKKENQDRPTTTAKAFRLLRTFVGWCGEHPDYQGIVNPEVCTQKRVRQEVAKSNAKAADTMQREQLAAWIQAVRAIGNPVSSAYLQAVLLTGARRDEVLSLKWADVDFTWHSLTIADKVEGLRVIPLPPYLASLLAGLPRRQDKEGKPIPWVFSSLTAASRRIQDPRLQLDKACMVAGIPKVTIHGLRRTFKNMAEWAELPAGVTAQLMGHKPSAIAERHYTSRPLDLLRAWHCKLEAWILEQAGIEQPKEEQAGLRLVKA